MSAEDQADVSFSHLCPDVYLHHYQTDGSPLSVIQISHALSPHQRQETLNQKYNKKNQQQI